MPVDETGLSSFTHTLFSHIICTFARSWQTAVNSASSVSLSKQTNRPVRKRGAELIWSSCEIEGSAIAGRRTGLSSRDAQRSAGLRYLGVTRD